MSKKVEDIKQKVNQKHIEFYDKTLSVLEFMLDEYAREIKYAEFEFIDAPKNSLVMIDFLISAIGKVQKGQRLALGLDDDVVVNTHKSDQPCETSVADETPVIFKPLTFSVNVPANLEYK